MPALGGVPRAFANVPVAPVQSFSAAPLPSGALITGQNAALNSVSCTGLNDCVAVGSFRTKSGNQLFIANEVDAKWTGGARVALPKDVAWSWDHSPNPITQFNSVSCSSTGNCVAVGTYLTAAGFEPLVAMESSGTWAGALRVTLPSDAAATGQAGALFSVACTSVGNCHAVGTYLDTSGNQEPLALDETASVWASALRPALPVGALAPSDQLAELSSISCWSAGNCSAVGGFVNAQGFETMVLNETNNKWASSSGDVTIVLPSNAASPVAAAGNLLSAIDCPSSSSCIAVGDYLDAGSYVAMSVTGSATTWSNASSLATPSMPAPSGEIDASLNAINCVSTNWCVAVGDFGTTSTHSPMSAVMSGTTFGSLTLGELPTDAALPTVGSTNGASCFAASDCVVVGEYVTTSNGTEGFVATPTTVPAAPTAVIGLYGDQSVHLHWDAPSYTGGLALTGYVATASPGNASCSTTGATNCTVSGLVNGQSYHFRVSALNALGSSAPSLATVAVTPLTVPGAPTLKKLTALAGALKLTFVAPHDNGGATILTYQYSLTGGTSWHSRPSGTNSTTFTISALLRHHSYRVAVRALNVVGSSLASNVLRATTK
jgi:hypothetical protein